MCGIIGYVGSDNAIPKITKGLSVLEYRGYDSVGLAARQKEGIKNVKCKGRIDALKELLVKSNVENSTCAIGHTRWATHGGPSDINAHPHRVGKTVIVHNGIIENYKEIKKALDTDSISETDTEVAAALIDKYYSRTQDPIKAINKATGELKGSYAFGIMFEDSPETIYAVRHGSPLILARSEDGHYIASDMTAILSFTRQYFYLDEGDIACLTDKCVEIYTSTGEKIAPSWNTTTMTAESAQKEGFPHFMLKEIHEQPSAVVKSVSSRIKNGLPDYSVDGITDSFWKNIKNIQIVACGSAIHAGIAGGKLIEELAKIPTNVYIASEYRYSPPLTTDGTLVLLISQSGETADTLAALRYAKSIGLPTLAIVNAVETSIAREADKRIYTYAGPEIAVATTKGYCTQLSELYMLAVSMGLSKGELDEATAKNIVNNIVNDAPEAIRAIIDKIDEIKNIAKKICDHEHAFYIGRGMDYALSMEAALKLKEISYIHCEAYAAGELKHGTISLITSGTPVIALATSDELFEKTDSNIREVKSRGAFVVLICKDDVNASLGSYDVLITVPFCSKAATLFATMTAVQLLAYEAAALLGCDIDRPRNLAKSVTVE